MKLRPLLVLALLALLPHLTGLFHEFVYDDHGALVENRFFSDPDAWSRVLTLRTFSEARTLDGTRPTWLASVLLDRALGAREAWHFRATNMALHVGCVLLLYAWLVGVLRRSGDAAAAARAFIAALLFAVHPLASEAIQVPSFREDPLALFWMLVALNLMPVRRGWVRAPLQLMAFLLALGAKEYAATLPLLAALVWWCFPAERPSRARGALEDGVGTLLALAFLTLTVLSHAPQAAAGPWNGVSLRWPENLWTAPWLFMSYLKLLVAPWPLSIDRVVNPVHSAWALRFLFGVFVMASAASMAVVSRRTRPLLALGMGWLLFSFIPVSNLIPLHNPLADRYAYALVAGFVLLPAALPLADPVIRRGLTAVAVVYVVLLLLRLPDLTNDTSVWIATARVEPRSARAQVGLGLAALHRNDLDTAAQFFARADELNPQDVTGLLNLAMLDGRQNKVDAAAEKLEEAIRRRPDKAEAWANLALARELQGRREEAVEALEKAQRLDPLGRY